jgi:predicted DNA-binding transcriptional regulator YafY
VRRLERLHAITEEIRLRSPRSVSAAHLAEEMGVSRRTVERDLATLRSSGLPLMADPGRRGGQRLHPRAVLPPLNLTERETTAVLVALTISEGMPFTDAAHSAASKLRALLPDVTAVATEDLCRRIRITQPGLAAVSSRTLHVREDAVASGTVLRLAYTDRAGVRTEREVEPVGFLWGGDGWYLGAWCRLRADRRLFRLDRIATASVTTERAPQRDLDEILGWLPAPTVPPR